MFIIKAGAVGALDTIAETGSVRKALNELFTSLAAVGMLSERMGEIKINDGDQREFYLRQMDSADTFAVQVGAAEQWFEGESDKFDHEGAVAQGGELTSAMVIRAETEGLRYEFPLRNGKTFVVLLEVAA